MNQAAAEVMDTGGREAEASYLLPASRQNVTVTEMLTLIKIYV